MRLKDLTEGFDHTPLTYNLQHTLPPTTVVPELDSGNNFPQYRFMNLMAAANAIKNGEVEYKPLVHWADSLSVVNYTKEEADIIALAAKIAGFEIKHISTTKSQEPKWVQKQSPVAKFKMSESSLFEQRKE